MMKRQFAKLGMEVLESRENPSGWDDFWSDVGTYGKVIFTTPAVIDGLKEGGTNLINGARDVLPEIGRTIIDLKIIATTNTNDLQPTSMNSKLFIGAADSASSPQAGQAFDRQLVLGIATMGVAPLVQTGIDAANTGDWSNFSKQAGGFGLMVVAPYVAGNALGNIGTIPVFRPSVVPGPQLAFAGGGSMTAPVAVVWTQVGTITVAVPAVVPAAIGVTGGTMAVITNGPGGGAVGEPAVPPSSGVPETPAVSLPSKPGQLQHIFRDEPGHLLDSPANRALLEGLANDINAVLGSDRFGNVWAARLNLDGTQVWVQYRNGIIMNGGVNATPRLYNAITGLSGQ